MANLAQSGADFLDGFFSKVGDSVIKGVGSVTENILPRWVASQLDDQRTDQLFVSTFDDRYAGLRLTPTTTTVQGARAKPAGLLFDNINLSSGGLLIGGAVVLGLILLLRK